MFSRFPSPALLSPEPGAHPTVSQCSNAQRPSQGSGWSQHSVCPQGSPLLSTAQLTPHPRVRDHSVPHPAACTHRAGGNQAAPEPPGAAFPRAPSTPAKGGLLGLGGEHLIPPKHAWQSWRSVTNPAAALGTQAAPNAPAPASVNTLLGWDCFRNGINKEVAAQPGHQVTLASQTARALPAVLCPAVLCPAAHSPDTPRGQSWAPPAQSKPLQTPRELLLGQRFHPRWKRQHEFSLTHQMGAAQFHGVRPSWESIPKG